MNFCYTYILKCNDGSFYTGWTTNLRNRIREHNLGKASKYTRARLPVRLVYLEMHRTQSSAMKRECLIKKLNRVQKLKLINKNSKCLNAEYKDTIDSEKESFCK